MSTHRLTPDIWLAVGLKALQEQGPRALAAESLARRLNTTKGSFYWHFADVPAYHAALLDMWCAGAEANLHEHRAATGPADLRLRDFCLRMLGDTEEQSIRLWAGSDAAVATRLKPVDNLRLDYAAELLSELGLGNPAFASALLGAVVGLPLTLPDDPDHRIDAIETMIDTIRALP